jgi:hypothetical protein
MNPNLSLSEAITVLIIGVNTTPEPAQNAQFGLAPPPEGRHHRRLLSLHRRHTRLITSQTRSVGAQGHRQRT